MMMSFITHLTKTSKVAAKEAVPRTPTVRPSLTSNREPSDFFHSECSWLLYTEREAAIMSESGEVFAT